MGEITVETRIAAPRERCFDLARDVDAHVETAAFSRERCLPPGRTGGLLELGDTVTFEGRHFGLRLRLTARIVELHRPDRFVDEMLRGPFRRLRHLHEFREQEGTTVMQDHLEWEAPLGPLGRLADRLFLERYMERFLYRKQTALKRLAETQ